MIENYEGINNGVETLEQRDKNIALKIWAVVFGLLGAGMISAALFILLMQLDIITAFSIAFMMIGGGVLCVSELLLHRVNKALGTVASCLAIFIFILSVNFAYMNVYNFTYLMGFCFMSGAGFILLLISWIRKNIWYRVVTLIGAYICAIGLESFMDKNNTLMMLTYIVLLNVLVALTSVGKMKVVMNSLQMAANFIGTACILIFCYGRVHDFNINAFCLLFVAVCIHCLIFTKELFLNKDSANGSGFVFEHFLFYILLVSLMSAFAYFMPDLIFGYIKNDVSYNIILGFIAVGFVLFIIMTIQKNVNKWNLPCMLAVVVLFTAVGIMTTYITPVCFLIPITILFRVLSIKNIKIIRVFDIIFTGIACLAVFFNLRYTGILCIGLALSFLWTKYFNIYFDPIILILTAYFVSGKFDSFLYIPAAMAINELFLVLNNVLGKWRGNRVNIFNIFGLIMQGLCAVMLLITEGNTNPITCFMVFVFGLASIFVILSEQYNMDIKGKQVLVLMFIVYMTMIYDSHYPIINSVAAIVISVIGMIIGMISNKTSVSVAGFIFTLLICAKTSIIDLYGASTMDKSLFLLSAGAIILSMAIFNIIVVYKRKNNG